MGFDRIISIKKGEIIKKEGFSSLEIECQRLELFRKNGIKVPKFYGFTGDNLEFGRFERIFGYHNIQENEEAHYSRGLIQGILGGLGYWHPLFSISFDDTILTYENEIYLIDTEKQRKIGNKNMSKDKNYIDFPYSGKEDFLVRVIPSMNHLEMNSRGLSGKVIQAHQEGYETGLGENIEIDYRVKK